MDTSQWGIRCIQLSLKDRYRRDSMGRCLYNNNNNNNDMKNNNDDDDDDDKDEDGRLFDWLYIITIDLKLKIYNWKHVSKVVS